MVTPPINLAKGEKFVDGGVVYEVTQVLNATSGKYAFKVLSNEGAQVGEYDASGGAVPSGQDALVSEGDYYLITTAGTLPAGVVNGPDASVGDHLIALQTSPTLDSHWIINSATGSVSSSTSYVDVFTAATGWTLNSPVYERTVTAATHGITDPNLVQVYETVGADKKFVKPNEILILGTGDVTINVTETPDLRFDGCISIANISQIQSGSAVTFNATTDWVLDAPNNQYVYTVTAAIHGVTDPRIVQTYTGVSSFEQVDVDDVFIIDATKDVEIRVLSSPDLRFAGRVAIG